jgi:biotin synthase
MSKQIYLCAISNIISGVCNEDCGFCTQSVKHKADIQRYKKKSISLIIEEAKRARDYEAVGFCLVTAGKSLSDDIVEYVCEVAHTLKNEVPELSLIGCNGTASLEALKELKKAGIDNYNHNLESSKEYYPNICSSHSWEQRYQTCKNVNEAGLNLCSGGIFGLGESYEDRVSLLNSLKELNPMSVPINFFHPNPALKIQQDKMSKDEAFEVLELVSKYLPNKMLMVAGGRELIFEEAQYEIFKYGINSIVIGDYLTTSGNRADKDIKALNELGYEIARDCKR